MQYPPRALLSLALLLALAVGCAAGSDTVVTSTGTGGHGGSSSSTLHGGTGGIAGQGGTGGTTQSALSLCVLDDGPPDGPCLSALDFGTVAGGTQAKRMFRVDNPSSSDAVFETVTIADASFVTTTATFVPDPGTPGTFQRSDAPLPATVKPGASLWFEVTFSADGVAGPLPASSAQVTAELGGSPAPSLVVPMIGTKEACPDGKGACDTDLTNGCETDTTSSVDHCGSCGTVCTVSGGAAACVASKCTVQACTTPFADCDGLATNGCEANLVNSVANCGSCGNDCQKNHNDAFCNGGNCNIVGCLAGWADCNLDPADGCETDVNTTLAHCGGCNLPCAPPHAAASCAAGACKLGTCNTGWADCDHDAKNGCETDLTGSVTSCGACGNACTYPHGVGQCAGGACALAGCTIGFGDCDNNPGNGCETDTNTSTTSCGSCGHGCSFPHAGATCAGGTCALGACAAGFGNCDGDPSTGCETDLLGDVNHCGLCTTACSFPHAGASCAAGACMLGACAAGHADCNTVASDGCEVDTQSDPNNCGGCGVSCGALMPHAQVACNAGSCQFLACQAGYVNLDGNPANGCEYACTVQSTTDLPDDGFADANCDGIDGEVAAAVFVDVVTGNDGAMLGTRATPMKSISGGLALAQGTGKTQVLVSNGSYNERVALVGGVSIYGGYSAASGWARSAAHIATILGAVVADASGGHAVAMEGTNIIAPTTIDRLTLSTLAQTGTFSSSYGFYCNNCPVVTLKNSTIQSASGRSGTSGTSGASGASGGTGTGGTNGTCNGNLAGAPGGPGGASTCARTGGAGGKGGDFGANDGAVGGIGAGGTAGGAAGVGGDPGGPGGKGTAGTAGANGTNGAAGSGGALLGTFWVGNSGGNGTAGAPGNGGGGGGGGGGQGCLTCDDGNGNGGGGGGAGGCGGALAFGGAAGGGSFGVFVIGSNGIQLLNNAIASGNGGNGGAGGNGGNGGVGGNGASGAGACLTDIGAGGNGGNGGAGGRGGHGGGGAGGVSYAVYRVNTATLNPLAGGNSLSNGAGGLGGTSSGNAGANGAAGQVF
jgi:hypothetical protein